MFAIFDFDRFSKHDQIGEVKIPMNTIDLAQTIEEWRDLTSVDNDKEVVRAAHRDIFYFQIKKKTSKNPRVSLKISN